MVQRHDNPAEKSRVNRRTLVKGAAAGTAAAAAGLSLAPGAFARGGTATRGLVSLRQEAGPKVFYNNILREDPTSFDWNLNLYCNAEIETNAGLLTFDPDLNIVPDWAESYEANADSSVYTFHVRPDNQGWSNGDPVTAHDFIWSWTRLLDPANATPYPFILFDIKNAEAFNTGTPVDGAVPTAENLGLKAIDDWTLEVTLEGPRGNFLQKVAYFACVPAHRASVEEHGDQWALGEVPLVSNGPLKLDAWEHNVKAELSRNDGYWNSEQVHIDNVVDPIIPAAGTVLAYEQGEGDQRLDWANISAADLERYQNDAELSTQLVKYIYPGIWFLIPSNGVPPFDKIEVRRAVSHAVDRTRLVEVTRGLSLEAYCMVPVGVFGYLEDEEFTQIQSFDPQAAMDALVGTEYEGGENWPGITMLMRASEEVYNADIMATDVIAQLKSNLNMDISIQTIPQSSFNDTLFQNQAQLVFIRWWLDYPDADNCYGDMFYSRKASGKRQAWSNSEFDDLVLAGRAEPDPDKRLELYRQMERLVQTDVGYIPLVYRVDQYAFKPWVKNLPVNRQGFSVPDGNIYVRMFTQIDVEGRPAE